MNWQASTRTLEAIVGSTSCRGSSSVTLTFRDAQDRSLNVVFAGAVIPAVIAALAARLNEIVDGVDHADRPALQTLQSSHVGLSMNDQGQIALLIGLEGAGELPIQLQSEQLAPLRDELEEAMKAIDPSRHN